MRPQIFIPLGLAGAIGVLATFGSVFTVHERERAVVTRNGAFRYVADAGLHLKAPFIDSVETFDLSIRSLPLPKLETFTVDNQHVDVDMTVQYRLSTNEVERVFRETKDYEQRLQTMAVDRMKIALGKRKVDELPEQRGAVAGEVFLSIQGEAQRLYGLTITDIQIGNINYSEAFRRAIDASAVAKAKVEQAHQQQREAEIVAKSAQISATGQAEAAIAAARGQAESRRLNAIAEAEALRLRDDAEASAIQAKSRALGDNPLLVQLEQASRWNGGLPMQMLGTAPVPFLSLQRP